MYTVSKMLQDIIKPEKHMAYKRRTPCLKNIPLVFTARSELRKVLFLVLSVTFLFDIFGISQRICI